ncbi:MAG: TetR/AcrR family transcriptional regulator [Gammaproteobacteria bacterium]|nr:TetR/AcrR family transcriptional regulator [Gammaproteobacteria bacterium]
MAKAADNRGSGAWGEDVPSRDEQHDIKRRAILRTAAVLFSEKGFRETSLNDIASALNVTKPTLYYYVKNKDDILFQCLHTALEELEVRILVIDQSNAPGLEKLRRFVEAFVTLFDGDLGRCVARPGLDPLGDDYRDRIQPFYHRVDARLRTIITAGIEDGSIAACDPKIAAFTLFGAMNWIIQWFDPALGYSAGEIAAQMNKLFINGMRGKTL